jgi:hypothetical protein
MPAPLPRASPSSRAEIKRERCAEARARPPGRWIVHVTGTRQGCQVNFFQSGDLDFDGSPYWTEWPAGNHPNIYPSTFVERFPTTSGRQYPQYFFQADITLSESTCTAANLSGCTVPPRGPGGFYP